MHTDEIKTMVIGLAKETLARIPFQSVANYATTLFNNVHENEIDNNTMEFLKQTRLRDLQFENESGDPDFSIKNIKTGQSIMISNRLPMKGELRGWVLRAFLNEQKQINENTTIYAAIAAGIKKIQYSNLATMVKSAMTSEYHDHPMSKAHFDLFLTQFIDALNALCAGQEEKIQRELATNIDITKTGILFNIIQKIDIDDIYECTNYQQAKAALLATIHNPNTNITLKRLGKQILKAVNALLKYSTNIPLYELSSTLKITNQTINDPTIENTIACETQRKKIATLTNRRKVHSALLILAGVATIIASISVTLFSFGALSPISLFGIYLGASLITGGIAIGTTLVGAAAMSAGTKLTQVIPTQAKLLNTFTTFAKTTKTIAQKECMESLTKSSANALDTEQINDTEGPTDAPRLN